MYARTSNIRSIAQSQTGTVHPGSAIDARGSYLVSNDSLKDYRAIVAELDYRAGQPVALSAEMCAALNVTDAGAIRLIAL